MKNAAVPLLAFLCGIAVAVLCLGIPRQPEVAAAVQVTGNHFVLVRESSSLLLLLDQRDGRVFGFAPGAERWKLMLPRIADEKDQ